MYLKNLVHTFYDGGTYLLVDSELVIVSPGGVSPASDVIVSASAASSGGFC